MPSLRHRWWAGGWTVAGGARRAARRALQARRSDARREHTASSRRLLTARRHGIRCGTAAPGITVSEFYAIPAEMPALMLIEEKSPRAWNCAPPVRPEAANRDSRTLR